MQLPSKRYHLQLEIRNVTYTLPALDHKSIAPTAPNQVGVNRPVEMSSQSVGKRFTNFDGTQLLVLAIKSPGAKHLRAHFANFDLRAGDEVYLHGPSDNSTFAGPYRDTGPWGDKNFWSSSIDGDTLIIEYHIHSTPGSFRIPEISHIYSDPQAGPMFDVLGCEVDASCSTDINKNAVGRILFIEDGNAFVCTGTLLNDSAMDNIPYFLTANHCVSTQTVAQTVETYWFYQTSGCNSGVLRDDIGHSANGANLLVTGSSKDFTLLKLVDTPPAGVVFAGWNSATFGVNTSVYGLHHPGGFTPPDLDSYLRRAQGTIVDLSTPCGATGLSSSYQVDWSVGLAETGSSGSGLWYAGRLIGVLSCINADLSCTDRRALYSKFSDFYPLIQPYINASTNYTITTVSLPSNGGTTSGAGTFAAGTSHTVSASANSGYTFVNWTENGSIVSTSTNYTFTLNSNRNLVANFRVSGTGAPAQTINLSTRMRVQTGENVGIGGFIITGSTSKHVLLRAIGPSLTQFGIPNVLEDPVLELHGPGAFATITNDNWRDTQEAAIQATGIPPTNNLESAIDATLAPGAYSAIVRGNGDTSGVALVEAYDLSQSVNSKLANISTRAFVSTGGDIVIAGFILGGNSGADRVVVRGIGPSLVPVGVANALANPTLELRDSNGALLASNNDWQDNPAQRAELIGAGLAPTDPLESAIAMTLPPGLYSALLRGLNMGTGVGLVEVYDRGAP